jgi:hypothetical protein
MVEGTDTSRPVGDSHIARRQEAEVQAVRSEYWRVGGTLLSLLALLLPVIGFGIRLVAFVLGLGPGPVVSAAAAAPVSVLAATAVAGAAVALGALVFLAVFALLGEDKSKREAKEPKRKTKTRMPKWMPLSFFGLAVIAIVLTTSGFPAGLVLLGGSMFAGGLLSVWEAPMGRVPLTKLWLPAVILALTAAGYSGLGGNVVAIYSGEVDFSDEILLTDGVFVYLGQAEGVVYFVECPIPLRLSH